MQLAASAVVLQKDGLLLLRYSLHDTCLCARCSSVRSAVTYTGALPGTCALDVGGLRVLGQRARLVELRIMASGLALAVVALQLLGSCATPLPEARLPPYEFSVFSAGW